MNHDQSVHGMIGPGRPRRRDEQNEMASCGRLAPLLSGQSVILLLCSGQQTRYNYGVAYRRRPWTDRLLATLRFWGERIDHESNRRGV